VSRRAVALALLGTAAAVGACGSSQPASRVLVDCEQAAYKPVRVVIACGDGGLVLTGLRWSSWGEQRAAATGVAQVNLCVPDCARGTTGQYPVRVVFDARQQQVLSRAVLTYPAARPDGQRVETFDHLVPLAPVPKET
jgi:hypothetical protein